MSGDFLLVEELFLILHPVKMLKSFVNLTKPRSIKALTSFISSDRSYCATKAEGKNINFDGLNEIS